MRLIEDVILETDPVLDRNDPGLKYPVIVLAAAFYVGPDVDRLVSFTDYPRKLVVHVSSRMHAAGIWRNGTSDRNELLTAEGHLKPVALWTQSLVAEGLLVVSGERNGQRVYRAIDPNSETGILRGRKRYRLDRREDL
jgi:hypothetical protein